MTLPTFDPKLLAALRNARHITVLTGAGISAESGIPTFREAHSGYWSQFRPEDLATMEAFRRNPKLVWDWYAERRQMVAEAQPNAGHRALVELAQRVPAFTLVTQNVDGLHQRAGSTQVIELHGNLARVKCLSENSLVEQWQADENVPRCPNCGDYLRPDVVWFGEMLGRTTLRAALDATLTSDVFMSIGTSGLIEPAASLPLEAVAARATVVEINPDITPLSPHMHYTLRGTAGTILPALVAAL